MQGTWLRRGLVIMGDYYFGTHEFDDEFQQLIDTFDSARNGQLREDKDYVNETPICTAKEFENVCKELGLEKD